MAVINVYDTIGSVYATLSSDGDKIYEAIDNEWYNCRIIGISFRTIEVATTCFLNNAIGKLYSKYATANIKDKLHIINANQDILANIKIVVDNAKIQFDA